jgi:hypothetical protein
MTCAEAKALRSRDSAEFAAHLRGCDDCTLDEKVRRALLADAADSREVDARVLRMIAADSERPPADHWRWAIALAGLAAAVVIAIAAYRVLFPNDIPALDAAAARDHQYEIIDNQPRKWFTDTASIESLATREGVPPAIISSLAPAGYKLEKGKLCRLSGELFLHLVYSDGAKNYSLFLTRRSGGSAPGNAIVGSERIEGFTKGDLKGIVVTTQTGDAVDRFAHFAEAHS